MRHTYKALIAALMAAFVLAGCQNEDPIKEVVEGLPVRLSFNVEVPNMDDIVITRATDEQETKIEKMAILFYNAKQENSKPIVVKVDDMVAPTQENTSTNWLYTINLDEEQLDGVYSGEWYMYPIANYDKYTVVDLNDLAGKTLKEFKEYTITASGRDITTSAVTMSGYYGANKSTHTITLQPGDNTFDEVFHLRRIVSKNIFKIGGNRDNGVTFTAQKYSIYNYSTSSTLLERDELNEYAGNETFTNFENLPISTEVDAEGKQVFTFYMPENVQAATKEGTWAYADRERRNADDYNTFTYAPTNATYVVIEGTYSGPGEGTNQATGNVKYTIHLGDFGNSTTATSSKFGNFSVMRNAKYTYTITVNGVNNIIAEAKKESDNQPGAEGQIIGPDPHVTVNLDAHYENVLLSFSASNIEKYSVSATIPAGNGAMTSFLDINGADKAAHTADVAWVKFGQPASTTTFANYPGDANVVDVYTLIEELKNGTSDHCIIDNNQVYVQAFVDEYFYDDKPYKDFVNTDDRTLSFTIGNAQISEDGHSSYIEGDGFTLNQKSIKTFYSDNVGNPFGVETVEETPAATFNSDVYAGSALQNGLQNTWEIVSTATTNETAITSLAWDQFVAISTNGFTGSTAPAESSIMTTAGTNPVYECLSRNRDLNGNGTIDEDEVKWYLPAFRQYIYTWCGKKALPTDITFDQEIYVSSTDKGYRVWWALEGTAICSWDTRYTSTLPKIRCARNLGTSTTGEVSSITDWDADNNIVTVSGLKDEAVRTNTQVGEYPEHENTDASSTLPKAFKIAENDLNIPASDDNYTPKITTVTLDKTGLDGAATSTTNHEITATIKIDNYDSERSYTYQIGNGTETKVDCSETGEFSITTNISHTQTGNNTSSSATIKVMSENGNYSSFNVVVTLTITWRPFTTYYTYAYTTTVPTETTVTGTDKNTFKYNELMTGDWCEKYYSEETDKSDLGQWRIPNEKELYFIQLYCGSEFTDNLAGYTPTGGTETGSLRYGAKTKYKRPAGSNVDYMIYYLQKDANSGTPIITTGDGQYQADFTLRCVRDAAPSSKSYDSSYGNGGTGFGL